MFTYPPFAAVLFRALAGAPLETDGALLTLMSIALAGVVIAVTLRAQGHRPHVWGLVAMTSVALLLEPVRETLGGRSTCYFLLRSSPMFCWRASCGHGGYWSGWLQP